MSHWMGKSRMIGIVALCLLLLLPATVSAIGVTGSKYMGSIKPGGTDIHTMTVSIGPDENPTDVLVEVYGFGQNMDQGYSAITQANDVSPYSARSFITLDTSSIHLEPGTSQDHTCNNLSSLECRPGREICPHLYPCPAGEGAVIYHCSNGPRLGHDCRNHTNHDRQHNQPLGGRGDGGPADHRYNNAQKYRKLSLLLIP